MTRTGHLLYVCALNPILSPSWHKPKFEVVLFTCGITATEQQYEKARGQLAQTRNHLQQANMPAIQPAECYEVQTKRFCIHVLLQAATATETGALKVEFQTITWESERRGLEEFSGLSIHVMPMCVSVCIFKCKLVNICGMTYKKLWGAEYNKVYSFY